MNTQKTIKLFRFPTPKSLGMSSYYIYNKRNDEKDFDDYLLYLKDNYPVRYFFAFFLQEWFNLNIVRKVKDIYWWFQHNFNPRHRYHMLDLRQPKSNLNYRYGWIDADTKMVYALFNILNQFVEHEFENFFVPTEEEVASEPHLKEQREAGLEILAIHKWWNITAPIMRAEENKALDVWYTAHKEKLSNGKVLFKRIFELEEEYKKSLEEYMIRLIKVRGWMWT